jgi:hypothetical protein
MLRHLFIFFILALPLTVSCQIIDTDYKNQIKVSALRLINIINPGIEISYERFHKLYLSSEVSVGYATNVIGKPHNHLKGYSIGFEEKYFVKMHPNSRKYFSLDFNCNNINYEETTSGRDTINNVTIIDPFTVVRKSLSLSFRYGLQFYRKQFVLDLNIGAGMKYRNVKHHDRIFEYKRSPEPFDFIRNANLETNGFVFFLPVNIRLGYRF